MKIIIPMSGIGNRFRERGYDTQKYLLPIFEKPIIKYVLDLFPDEDDINLILNEDDFNDQKVIKEISKFDDDNKIKYHFVEAHKKGPGYALLSTELLNTDEDVFINYCDFSNIWDWTKIKKHIKNNKPDGLLPAYKGVHLHTIYRNNYAFIKEQDLKLLSIKEKEPFTDDPMNEFASTGGYYFSTGKVAKKYINQLFEKDILINGEAYISSAYDLMAKDGLEVDIYKIDHFFQWGTPEDYEEFIYCMNEIRSLHQSKPIDLKDINLVLPIAGEGKRFSDKGYKTPKIFLEIQEKIMIELIFNRFKNQAMTLFLTNNSIYKKVLELFGKLNNSHVFSTENQTRGQADSALKLINKIENELPIFVQSGDCILGDIDMDNVRSLNPDMVVFTKKNYRRAFTNPHNFGWVFSDENVIKKSKIKSSPEHDDYSMILGSFLFKNKEVYERLFNEIEKSVDTELHIDFMIEEAIKLNLKVIEINADYTSVIGTPLEYELHKYSDHIFDRIGK